MLIDDWDIYDDYCAALTDAGAKEAYRMGYAKGHKVGYNAGARDAIKQDEKHGKWISKDGLGYYYYCSECGYEVYWKNGRPRVCPRCGREMEGCKRE